MEETDTTGPGEYGDQCGGDVVAEEIENREWGEEREERGKRREESMG
jgi:hypothetical protein